VIILHSFSVVIPTCNRNELLKRAVQSVLSQRLISFEIIVVDDSTETDVSGNNIEQYLRQYDITYIKSGGNKGGAYCRNLGLSQARNEIVAFLDDDDKWQPDKLYTQALLMKNTDIALCYTGLSIRGQNGSLRYSFRKPGFPDHFKSVMKKNFIGSTSSVVAWRSHLEAVGGFDASLPALQDYDLYIRLLKRWKACWTPEPLTWCDDMHDQQRVSWSRRRYLDAREYMIKKYEGEKYYPLLVKSLKNIEYLKIIRSRQFLIETIRSILKR
jgi:glycosyltransferase involved in cell wall biosynthesis